MKKILPIEEKVRMYSYTYYSFQQAIIANDFRIGEIAAVVKLSGEYKWTFVSENMRVCAEKNTYTLKCKKYGIDMNALLYRPLNLCDEQELELLYYQFTSAFGRVSFYITDKEPEICNNDNRLLEFGTFCREELFYVDDNSKQTCYPRKRDNVMTLSLQKDADRCAFFCKQDEVKTKIVESKMKSCNQEVFLCVNINLNDNSYFDWLYQNFVQLKYNRMSEYIKLEFDFMIKRYWKYFTVNNFIDYSIEYIDMLQQLGIDVLNYIKKRIDNEYYIEMDLNSLNIEGTIYYEKEEYIHTCLIYGYNDDLKKIYLLSDNEGKLKKGELSYENFSRQMILNSKKDSENKGMLISHFYNPDPNGYVFSQRKFAHDLRCYLQGKSVIDANIIIPVFEYSYGMNVYKELLSEQGINSMIEDIRISAVIKEHKQVMVERFDYFNKKDMISDDLKKCLSYIAECIYRKACIVQNKILYSWVAKEKNLDLAKKTIYSHLRDMELIESDYYPVIIDFFEEKINEENAVCLLKEIIAERNIR